MQGFLSNFQKVVLNFQLQGQGCSRGKTQSKRSGERKIPGSSSASAVGVDQARIQQRAQNPITVSKDAGVRAPGSGRDAAVCATSQPREQGSALGATEGLLWPKPRSCLQHVGVFSGGPFAALVTTQQGLRALRPEAPKPGPERGGPATPLVRSNRYVRTEADVGRQFAVGKTIGTDNILSGDARAHAPVPPGLGRALSHTVG